MAGLAHAIKNIAGGLKGGAFVVEKGLQLSNRHYLRQGWQMVQDNVARIQQLSLDLLNIASPGEPRFQETDPNKPLMAVYSLIQPQAQQFGIQLKMDAAPDLPSIPMEAESIHRCLLSLVTNAMDACSQAGCRCGHPRIDLVSRADAEGIEYRVRDNCGGMEKTVQEKLFHGFLTTKGSRGTGIGLMLTRKIIEAHHGQIQVHSEPGQGTEFIIRLSSRKTGVFFP